MINTFKKIFIFPDIWQISVLVYRSHVMTKWRPICRCESYVFVMKDSASSLFSMILERISLTSAKSCKIVSIFQLKQQLLVQKALTTKTREKTTLTLTLKNTICPHNVQSCAKPISSRPRCQRAAGQSPDAPAARARIGFCPYCSISLVKKNKPSIHITIIYNIWNPKI